jgi:16S rRNA processing protein RimM
MTEKQVVLAAVAGAHGVTGEVRLKLFAESVDSLKRHKSYNGGALTLKSVRAHKGGAIARFAEITDRNAAEALRSTLLTVSRAELPPLGEGEYYYSDLIGLKCVSTDGEELGNCIAVDNFGAATSWKSKEPDKKRFMVPMNAKAVPEWGERIVVEAAFVQ